MKAETLWKKIPLPARCGRHFVDNVRFFSPL
ncbi:hypothetical protein FP2506_05461 [Fulvimarina pelagi HTCC2506]|uniref:Uncharacterized protein n=1 Tax=Fulvimarina pelagi HTCC2506 TaxID=314231 RepID=Q0G7V4_9HYPH|nr:hypothetical protein FP2506_05461 [Fulvimarina pelagi HTCC2506]